MSNDKQLPLLEAGCVIEFGEKHFITEYQNHRVFLFDELAELLYTNISDDIDHDDENWSYTGIECSVMIPGQNWQKGRLKLRLQFIPDEVEENAEAAEIQAENESDPSPLDDIRQSLLNEAGS